MQRYDRKVNFLCGMVLGVSAMFQGACSQGIAWRGLVFEPVHADARRDHKLTFVYFRHWAVIACTNFEESVLKTPEVRHLLRPEGNFYCVVLDAYTDRALAEEWGVPGPPAIVVLDSEERVLRCLSGTITVEQLLNLLREVENTFSSKTTQPARAP